MKALHHTIFSALLVSSFLMFQCSTDKVSGIEITNGECTGKIFNQNNTAAVGATVRLIPAGYDPASTSDATIDSTKTDAEGRYTFKVSESDFYNIIAEKGDESCIQDSVSLLEDGKNLVEADTLEASGWLAGKIEVKPGSDPRNAVLIVMGTTVFTSPYDSLGGFITPALPSGKLQIKVFTTETGYGVYDSVLTIPSGDTLEKTIRIPLSYVPAIGKVDVSFNKGTMFAKVEWAPLDTALFHAYALHRITGNATLDTMIQIAKTVTTFNDDLVRCLGDTVRYELSAVGENFVEGYLVSTAPFAATSDAVLVKQFKLPAGDENTFYSNFFMDNKNYCYLLQGNTVEKVNALGNVVATYLQADLPLHAPLHSWIANMLEGDTLGNIYIVARPNPDSAFDPVIVRLDADLKKVAEFVVPDSILCFITDQGYTYHEIKIAVSPDGEIYVYSVCLSDRLSTKISVFDGSFVFKRQYEVMDEKLETMKIERSDLIIATCQRATSQEQYPDYTTHVLKFDGSFHKLSEVEVAMKTGLYCQTDDCSEGMMYPTVINEHLYVTGVNARSSVLMVADSKGTLKARLLLPTSYFTCFISQSTMMHVIYPLYLDKYGREQDGWELRSYSINSLLTR